MAIVSNISFNHKENKVIASRQNAKILRPSKITGDCGVLNFSDAVWTENIRCHFSVTRPKKCCFVA